MKFILNGLEKYMSFSINNKLSFIDSFQCLSFSLDSLVKRLGKDDFQYFSLKLDCDVLDLIKQKGFYPDNYMNSFEKFKVWLPTKEKFYNSLTDKKISDNEYKHIPKVWHKLEIKTIKDYYDLLLKYVLLSSDVFQKFKNSSLKNYGLCQSHYFSVLALSWATMLNIKKVELELISNVVMYLFFEKGMGGGVSFVSKRYSEVNNKYLKFYDPKQESKSIIYFVWFK